MLRCAALESYLHRHYSTFGGHHLQELENSRETEQLPKKPHKILTWEICLEGRLHIRKKKERKKKKKADEREN